MPQQFDNTPQKPISVEDSRSRLTDLMNKKVVEGAKTRSPYLNRDKFASEEQKTADQLQVEPDIANQESPDEKVDQSLQIQGEIDITDQISQVKEEQQVEVDENAVEDAGDSQPVEEAEEKELDVSGLDHTEGTYWHRAWDHFIDGTIINTKLGEKKILEVQLPQDNEIEAAAAEQLYASLAGLEGKQGKVFETLVGLVPKLEILFKNPHQAISFEIVASNKDIRFWVVVPTEISEFIEQQIHGAYPEAEIMSVEADDFLAEKGYVEFQEMETSGKPFYPIRLYDDFGVDPMSSLTTVMSKLEEGERVVMQLLIQPADDLWRKNGQGFVQSANQPAEEGKKPKVVDQKVVEAVSNKVSKPGFRIVIRNLVQAENEFKAKQIMAQVEGAFDQFSLPHLAQFKTVQPKATTDLLVSFITRSFPEWGNYPILNTSELATIYHFPNNQIQTPRVQWLRARKSAPPTNMPKDGLYLGISEYRNEKVEVKLGRDDRRRHLYTIGQTGSGKTQFLTHMAYQDIMNGDGLAFIDPHGDAVEDLLQMIPKERAEDVIYFNPADTDRPMGINILEASSEDEQHRAVNSFIGLLYKLYDPNHSGIVGPQLERAVRNVMLTAMSEPGNTMIEVLRLLTNPKFAEKKIKLIKDPMVKTYWTEQLAQTSEHHKSETLGYFVSKFDRFVTEKLMRNIIGQSHSAFNFREIMDKQKILLINLSKGKLGDENSSFLGLLLVPRILMAAMSRADMPQEERKDFYLYVDEFQNFSTPDFAEILAEARKYRLSLTVANQYISQLNEEIRDAVFGNVGTMANFRVGANDSEYMEKQFEPVFKQNDLINLSIGESVVRLLIDGQPSRPFSFKTDWPAMQAIERNPKIAEVIKEISRLKYGRDRGVVESEIAVRAGF